MNFSIQMRLCLIGRNKSNKPDAGSAPGDNEGKPDNNIISLGKRKATSIVKEGCFTIYRLFFFVLRRPKQLIPNDQDSSMILVEVFKVAQNYALLIKNLSYSPVAIPNIL